MTDTHHYQYAFARSDCSTEGIGAGVDPRFPVELFRYGLIAAVISGVGMDQFDPVRLQGGTAEDLAWLKDVASRHDEIIRQAARSSPVAPLRMGTMFNSLDSLQASMGRLQARVLDFFNQLGDRQEWGLKLYRTAAHARPQREPLLAASFTPGAQYLSRKKAALESHRQSQTDLQQTIEYLEQRLSGQAGAYCRVRTLPRNLTGRNEEMVFNAAILLPPSALDGWLETAAAVRGDLLGKGLLLEWSGPKPPYHFCFGLDLS